MKDIWQSSQQWFENGNAVAIATVIQTWGSSPRQAGANMIMTQANQIRGSVSGGCIEGAVYEAGMEVLDKQQPQLLHFGVADETAWEVGLACGGTIDVFVERLLPAFLDCILPLEAKGQAYAVATIIKGNAPLIGQKLVWTADAGILYTTLPPTWQTTILSHLENSTQTQRLPLDEETDLFLEWRQPPYTLIIVGGVHIATALVSMAKTMGYQTIVIDPRRAFGNEARFPHVDQLIQAWPQKALASISLTPRCAVALLTHDPKIDDPALHIVLNSPVFYVGALGSRTTHQKRTQRLLGAGLSAEQIERIHAPIGLNLGGRLPAEIALAIMAEVIQAQYQA